MSAADPYVVVRRGIVDDARFAMVWADAELLGWWLKLRLAADAAWPASAEIPAAVPPGALDDLVTAGHVVRYPGSRFRMPDYDLEREARARRGIVGGRARAEGAARSASGRYQRTEPATGGSEWTQPLNATQSNTTQASSLEATDHGDELWPRRELAQAIREAPTDDLRRRHRARFEAAYGPRYGRTASA